jgi:hypothetical protein
LYWIVLSHPSQYSWPQTEKFWMKWYNISQYQDIVSNFWYQDWILFQSCPCLVCCATLVRLRCSTNLPQSHQFVPEKNLMLPTALCLTKHSKRFGHSILVPTVFLMIYFLIRSPVVKIYKHRDRSKPRERMSLCTVLEAMWRIENKKSAVLKPKQNSKNIRQNLKNHFLIQFL